MYNSIDSNFEFLIAPSIQLSVICGMDFWKTFGISIQHSILINEIDCSPVDDSSHICLSNAQKSKLKKVIDFFLSLESEGLGLTRLIEHNIDNSTAKPIKQSFYPLSPANEKVLCVEIDRMIEMDIIEEAPSLPWSTPLPCTSNRARYVFRMLFRFQ